MVAVEAAIAGIVATLECNMRIMVAVQQPKLNSTANRSYCIHQQNTLLSHSKLNTENKNKKTNSHAQVLNQTTLIHFGEELNNCLIN
jgi:hypothetical protein